MGPARRYRPPAPAPLGPRWQGQKTKTPAPPRRQATASPRTTSSHTGKFAPFTQPQSVRGDQSSLEAQYNASAGLGIVQKNNSSLEYCGRAEQPCGGPSSKPGGPLGQRNL